MDRHLMLKALVLVSLICGGAQAAAWMELARPPEQITYDGQPAWEYWYDVYASGLGPPTQVWIDFDASQVLDFLGTTHYKRWDSAAAGCGFGSGADVDPRATWPNGHGIQEEI